MVRQKKFFDLFFLACLFVFIIICFLVISPKYQLVPHRDSGIFLHIGSQILDGKVLYLETWDHKQPVIYLLNAAGLWMGGKSTWGVWGLELGLFLIIYLVLYCLLRKKLPPGFSFAITTISFLTIFQIMSGNFSEEYAIFFQGAILAMLFLIYLPDKKKCSRPFSALIMGLLSGISFCIKQTYIDIAISSIILLLFLAWMEKDKTKLGHILWFGLGFLLINGALFLYFWIFGAIPDYLFGAYYFNLVYSNQGLIELIQSIFNTAKFISNYPLLIYMSCIWAAGIIVIIGKFLPFLIMFLKKRNIKWIILLFGIFSLLLFLFAQVNGKSHGIGLLEWATIIAGIIFTGMAVFLFFSKKSSDQNAGKGINLRKTLLNFSWFRVSTAPFLLLGLLDLPIVIMTISLSGENFPHYYISLLLPLFLLVSASVLYTFEHIQKQKVKIMIQSCLIAIFVWGAISPTQQIIWRLQHAGSSDSRASTAAYLKQNTSPEDKILVWGYESVIYFLSQRDSPTRFSIQVPAYYSSSFQPLVLNTILENIQTTPPLYIVDTNDPTMTFIMGESIEACLTANPINDNGLNTLLNYVCSNYEFAKQIEDIDIYKLSRLPHD